MSQTAYRTHHATEVTEELVGQKVTLSGWVDRRRDHGGVAFIDLRDNTGLVQVSTTKTWHVRCAPSL